MTYFSFLLYAHMAGVVTFFLGLAASALNFASAAVEIPLEVSRTVTYGNDSSDSIKNVNTNRVAASGERRVDPPGLPPTAVPSLQLIADFDWSAEKRFGFDFDNNGDKLWDLPNSRDYVFNKPRVFDGTHDCKPDADCPHGINITLDGSLSRAQDSTRKTHAIDQYSWTIQRVIGSGEMFDGALAKKSSSKESLTTASSAARERQLPQ